MRPHDIKTRIHNHRPVYRTAVREFRSSAIVPILVEAGFDYAIIDMEAHYDKMIPPEHNTNPGAYKIYILSPRRYQEGCSTKKARPDRGGFGGMSDRAKKGHRDLLSTSFSFFGIYREKIKKIPDVLSTHGETGSVATNP